MTSQSGLPPLVSIIVPVYNGERYLRESLDSILDQSYPNIDVLVMDDASTDGTASIIASYGDRIRSYRQPENRGIYGNMNDGIARVQGEYVAIYHSDDVYDRKIVEREVQYLEEHPDVGAVFAKDLFIDPEGRRVGQLELPEGARGGRPLDYRAVVDLLLTHKNHIFRCPSCMARASVYREVGAYRDTEFRNTSDLEMYLRISKHYQVGVIDEFLYSYRWGHGNSGQRYRALRTDPNRFFPIMDLYLQEHGGRALASRRALADFEAHRSEDDLMRAINLYILDRLPESRRVLDGVSPARLLPCRRVVRWRLLTLFLVMSALVRLPRAGLVAELFRRRWHSGKGLKRPLGWHSIVAGCSETLHGMRKAFQR